MPSTYEPIATTTLGSATNIITFSSIPATYTDLKISAVFQNTTAAYDTWLSLNGTTTGNLYSQTRLSANGSTVSANAGTSLNQGIPITQTGATVSPHWSFCEIDIFSYAASINKTLLVSTSQDKNGSGQVERYVGLFRSTSAITSLSLYYVDGNFSTGTTATLYGIKNA
jgi:hypothetical protein